MLVVAFLIVFFIEVPVKYLAISECILFFLLGVQLLVVNFLLLKQINELLGSKEEADKKFATEKRFLISTLVFFSISYLVAMIKNIIIYEIIVTDIEKFDHFFCSSNFKEAIINIGYCIIAVLMPYLVIFFLNYKNFSQMDLQDKYIE